MRIAPLSSSFLSRSEDLPPPPTFDPSTDQMSRNQTVKGGEDDEEGRKKGNTLGNSGGAKVPKWLQKVGGSACSQVKPMHIRATIADI